MMSAIRKAIVLIVGVFFAALICGSCRKDPLPPKPSENPIFSLELPPDYYLVNGIGKDSYVGYYNGPRGSFGFDCGAMSFGKMEEIEVSSCLYYEDLIVADTFAKLVIHEYGDGPHLAMYIDKDGEWQKLRLYTSHTNPDDIAYFRKIFSSLKFK